MKTIWQFGRSAFARALSRNISCASGVGRKLRRIVGAVALACATVMLSFGAAQAQGTQTIASTTPNGFNTFGQPTTFNASVTGFPNTGVPVPGGTVTFTVISLSGGSLISTVPVSNGQATFTVALLPVGFVGVVASYNGDDPNFPSQSSGSNGINIVPADTTTTLTFSNNPSNLGSPVTLTATREAPRVSARPALLRSWISRPIRRSARPRSTVQQHLDWGTRRKRGCRM